MPSDFSKKIASSGGDSPETGALQVRTNDANNYIVGQISKTVFGEVRNAASTNASRGFLDRIFISFSDLHDKTAEAAKGADDLKGGISKAKQGSKDLADGLKDSKAGSKKLSDGIVKLNQGSRRPPTGSRQVAGGSQVLADKVNGIAGDVRPFFKDNGKSIQDTARLVADTSAGRTAQPRRAGEDRAHRGDPRPEGRRRAGRDPPDPVRGGRGARRHRLPAAGTRQGHLRGRREDRR
ncbi:hypothetical protein SBADM41S_04255 [Streptomyces badius]